MTHLNIQQGSGVEIVSAQIIKKLYDTALTVSEPLEGETDAAYMSGHISVPHSYQDYVYYLAGKIGSGTSGVVTSQINNPTGRFQDLTIDVVNDFYIRFEDPVVESTLITEGYSSDGVGITINEAQNANVGKYVFGRALGSTNDTITSFKEFGYFTLLNNNPPQGLFSGCVNLKDIDLSHVTVVSAYEFNSTDLSGDLGFGVNGDLNLPNLSVILEQSFGASKIKTISNLGNITSISTNSFVRCPELTSVVIPLTVTTINASAFDAYNSYYKRVFTTITGLSNVTTYGNNVFRWQENLVIQTSDLVNVTSIGNSAFERVKFTGILDLPKLQSLGNSSFWRTTISQVKCLGNIDVIPDGSFGTVSGDSNKACLTSAYLPYGCTSIGKEAFSYRTGLTTVKKHSQAVTYDNDGNVVSSPDISTATNLSGVTTFGNQCFEGCTTLSLTNADITDAVSIGNNSFKNTSLTGNLSLPHVETLGGGSFYRCSGITSIDFTGSTFTRIENETFRHCSSLSKIVLPTTVTYLGGYWHDGLPQSLILEGFDNVSSHTNNGYDIQNKNILNPVKTSLIDGRSLFEIWSNNDSMRLNQLYEPLRTSTYIGNRSSSNYNYYTTFGTFSGGNNRAYIELLYYRDITSFGIFTFKKCNITNLVINNTQPPILAIDPNEDYSNYPIWANSIFPTGNSDANDNVNIGTLWVPDSAVATYQANPLYSHLTIKGINTKTNGVDYDLPRYVDYAAWKTAEEAAVAQGGHASVGLIEAWM